MATATEPTTWRVWYAYQGEDYIDVLAHDQDSAIEQAYVSAAGTEIVHIFDVEPRP